MPHRKTTKPYIPTGARAASSFAPTICSHQTRETRTRQETVQHSGKPVRKTARWLRHYDSKKLTGIRRGRGDVIPAESPKHSAIDKLRLSALPPASVTRADRRLKAPFAAGNRDSVYNHFTISVILCY